MFDEIDDLRVNLREAADGFRPDLDAAELAKAGRRVQRRNRILGGVAGAAALALVVGFGLPAILNLRPGVPAVPAENPTPSTAPLPSEEPSGFAVDMTGWVTFSSPEYPITFQCPPDWTVDDDLYGDGSDLGLHHGCDTINCVLFVNPPDPEAAAPLELLRNGFSESLGGGVEDAESVEEFVTIPDLWVWGSDDARSASQAVILSRPNRTDEPVDYMLGATSPTTTNHLAVGETNPRAEQPESRFMFTTNVGNIGGAYDDDGRGQVLMILGSARPNPDFNPTRPVEIEPGTEVIVSYPPMAEPDLTLATSSWKRIEVEDANLSVRIPPKWTVLDQGEGVIWIEAPSGYIVDLLTNGMLEACSAGPLPGSERLGAVDGLEAGAPGLTGTPEIRWVNGGQYPVWVGLTLDRTDKACFEQYLDFGGQYPVYLGSADNSANPTAKELSQAVAILASAERLS